MELNEGDLLWVVEDETQMLTPAEFARRGEQEEGRLDETIGELRDVAWVNYMDGSSGQPFYRQLRVRHCGWHAPLQGMERRVFRSLVEYADFDSLDQIAVEMTRRPAMTREQVEETWRHSSARS